MAVRGAVGLATEVERVIDGMLVDALGGAVVVDIRETARAALMV